MQHSEFKIRVSVSNQSLELLGSETNELLATFPVSTSAFGLGTEVNSLKTPLGRFRICEKIGDNADEGTVFKGRVPVTDPQLLQPGDDQVLTRILWLDGQDADNLNTRDRYIYIHGTNHESKIGTPASHGCVRMKNSDIVRLYDAIPKGTEVEIVA